ncbi:MAG: ATP-binding protein [Rhodothalassiaceae bacterium]
MIPVSWLLILSLTYLGCLFGVAWWMERRRRAGLPLPLRRWIYPMALSVWLSAWGYMGNVGRAADDGMGWAAIIIASAAALMLWPIVAGRMYRVCQRHRLTSIADLVAFRYGNSQFLAITITILIGLAMLPYLAQQLRAITSMLDFLAGYNPQAGASLRAGVVALIIAGFGILFSVRSPDATHKHPGLMSVLCVQGILKAAGFLTLTVILWLMFDGPDLLRQRPDLSWIFSGSQTNWQDWFATSAIGFFGVVLLPHMFHVGVVECEDELDQWQAAWVVPLVCLTCILTVNTIAFLGRATLDGSGVPPDMYILALAREGHPALALFGYLAGFSAATAMLIAAVTALSIMVSNHLALPLALSRGLMQSPRSDALGQRVMTVRRIAIAVILALAVLVYDLLGRTGGLSSLGFLALLAVLQLAPPVFFGMYWPNAARQGAIAGLAIGYGLWLWCGLVPFLCDAGLLPPSILSDGPWGLGWARPEALFGLDGLSRRSHALFWSLSANALALFLTSVFAVKSARDRYQAQLFFSAMAGRDDTGLQVHQIQQPDLAISMGRLVDLLARFVTRDRAETLMRDHLAQQQRSFDPEQAALGNDLILTERLLGGIVGSAGARVIMAREVGLGDDKYSVQTLLDEASAALVSSRALLSAAMENIPQGILVFDDKLRLLGWNRQVGTILTNRPEVLHVGAGLTEFLEAANEITQESPFCLEDRDARLLEELQARRCHRYNRTFVDGRVFEVTWTPTPDGGWLMVTTDVTAQKRTERQLREAKEMAELANRSKSEFLANMSHELRTPLNAIIGFADIMRQELFGPHRQPRYKGYAGDIYNAGSHLLRIISDILDLSKIETGQVELSREYCELTDLVEDCVLMVHDRAAAKRVQVHTDLAPGLPGLMTDPTRLKQVLLNLLSNAVKFNTDGGHVTVRAHRCAEGLMLMVEDTGIGMSEQDLEIALTRFGRARRAVVDAYEGSGLGLPLSAHLIKRMGGTLMIDSKVNEGTRIAVILPPSLFVEDQSLARQSARGTAVAS